jgi:predicted nucleotidyltransferase
MMVSVYYFGRSRDIADLRTSSKEALSLPDFKNILWIGVFGSFSRNQQTDRSDVDLVVVEHSHVVPAEYSRDANYEPWTLEELLPRVWCRPVEIVLLKEELRELVAIDSLLTSRTIYGDDQSVEILQLRRDARKYLDEGWEIFRNAEKDIEALKARISEVKDVEVCTTNQNFSIVIYIYT